MTTGRWYVGDESPKFVELEYSSSDYDLSTVTAAEILALAPPPDGRRFTWAATFTWTPAAGDEPGVLTVRHELAEGGTDLPVAGSWRIYARVTLPGGRIRMDPVTLPVATEFGL